MSRNPRWISFIIPQIGNYAIPKNIIALLILGQYVSISAMNLPILSDIFIRDLMTQTIFMQMRWYWTIDGKTVQ